MSSTTLIPHASNDHEATVGGVALGISALNLYGFDRPYTILHI